MSGLPPGWTHAALSEIGSWVGGGTPSKRIKAFWDGEIPWVSPKDMKSERIRDAIDHISIEAVEQSATNVVPQGSVLLVTRSGILRHTLPVAVVDREVALNQDLKALIPAAGISPDYLTWTIRARAQDILRTCSKSGTTVNNLETPRLLAYRIPIAPANEQQRIAAAIEEQFSRLDAADRALDSTLRRLSILRERSIEFALAGEWPWTTLGDVAAIAGGLTKDTKRQADPDLVEMPYLRVANVQRGFLDLTSISTIRVTQQKAAALALRPGDVLFNEGGDRDKLGRGWVWSGEIEPCIHQNHVFRARLRDGFEPKFVSWHGNTFGRRWFEINGRQTTNLASLNLTTLRRFPVPAPPIAEQRRIVAEIDRRLSVIDSMRGAIDFARRRSAALRRSILERAFGGELVSQDPSDEPATVLLERIQVERADTDGNAVQSARKKRDAALPGRAR